MSFIFFSKFRYIFFLTFGLFSISVGNGRNSIINQEFIADSVLVSDSLFISDSLSTKSDSTKKSDITDIVYSSAKDSLIFDVTEKQFLLFNESKIKYQKSELNAGKVIFNLKENNLYAFAIFDVDSTGDSVLTQLPNLSDNGESFTGNELSYNFKSKKGTISYAESKQKDKTFRGSSVIKVADKVYFIQDGTFTSCEGNPPITYFTSTEMKVIQDDKVFAKWILMWIAGVPMPVPLPFAVFPLNKERHSGLVLPSYGQDATRGFYFRGLGYYFALSDYFDLTFLGDFYFKGGYGLRSNFRYKSRYLYSGNLDIGLSRIIVGEENDPNYNRSEDWKLNWSHNQQFNPSSKLSVSLNYYSSNYLSTNSTDYDNLLRQNVISNATFSKIFDNGSSLSANYYRIQNLTTGDITEKLPDLSYNVPIFYPFKSILSSYKNKFLETVGIRYSTSLRNERTVQNSIVEWRAGIQHTASISASQKISYFNISPSFNYTSKWYDKHIEIQNFPKTSVDSDGNQVLTDSLVTRTVYGYNSVDNYNFRLSASTKAYGIMNVNAVGIEAFRHTITPSITYSVAPDFSSEDFSYYGSYKTVNGKTIRYDKYQDNIFGGASSAESQNISFSLGNIFEMKTLKNPTDTTSEQKKYQLLNLNAGLSYNFIADSLKLSDLRLSYRTSIGEYLSFNGSSAFTFYDFNETRKINSFLIDKNKGLMRMTSNSISISTRLSGEKLKNLIQNEEEKENLDEFTTFQTNNPSDLYENSYEKNTDFTIPWSLDLSYNYGYSAPYPTKSTTSQNVSLNTSFNITKAWKFSFRTNYDIENDEFSAPVFTAYRDLSCWEMFFTWYPLGTYQGFRFNIRLKAPELRDIKLEKTKNIFSGR